MIGLGKYMGLSVFAAGAVVYHAFATREQFYPSMQYLTSSKLAIAVVGNLGFATALCLYRLLTKIFLGTLREAEVERINERISQAIMETCLAMTIFREEFNVSFVAMFATLTFVKVFHWLVQDRVDYIETTPSTSIAQHVKIVACMAMLLSVDALFLQYTISETIKRGPSVLLLFAFEYVIQASAIVSAALKYAFIGVDTMLEGRWESKGVYVFYLELITDMLHLFVYLLFFIIVFTYYGLPLHLVRDLYWTFRNFRQRVSDFLRYRRVTANMNERFPNATAEDLERCDGTCIICREEMVVEGANKRLPCGHVFHLTCLRSWLERQQNCPTCRANVLQQPSPQPAQAPAVPQAPLQPAPPAAPAPQPAAQPQGRAQGMADEGGRDGGEARRDWQGVARQRSPEGRRPQPSAPASGLGQAGSSSSSGQAAAETAQQWQQQQQQQQFAAQGSYYVPQPWAPQVSMAMFPAYQMPQQYAGQQAAVPPGQPSDGAGASSSAAAPHQQQQPGASMPRISLPMVPLQMMMPQAYAVPASSTSATPEQHQAAAAAAAAATAAVYGPWSSMMAVPAPMAPTVPAEGQPSVPQASAAAAAAAAMISSSSQTPSTAAQVLRSHIEYLQMQMRSLEQASRGPARTPGAGTGEQQRPAVGASEKGKEPMVGEPAAHQRREGGDESPADERPRGDATPEASESAQSTAVVPEPHRSADPETSTGGAPSADEIRKMRLERLGQSGSA
uniref:RING-type E3 ubiquitin transferase n=1 Tax=Tetraselmis sp. GSL018 TaxID=582737 RepID=A0A061R0D6_9CHLO|eukprot:CAMPEP_0177604250 /NCGR_PEP_ID=MMETSP0419_2-20121207/16010_1 /TAXON_ID=582737 /ORGANISM="Tetraselmis sp., Strain GSL018" /LENGTH=732 /DNA_ID=CAMNT_0019098205 /DNA_START=135 /DNA_END=2333 /DNA_ORIENTATION=+